MRRFLNIGLTASIFQFVKDHPAGVLFGDVRSAMERKKFKVDDLRNDGTNRIGERLKRLFDKGAIVRSGQPGAYRYSVRKGR